MHSDALLNGLNEAQLRAVTTTGGPVVVLAGAGSGKTRVLTRRIAWRILEAETDPNRVLALTFTRAAAAELRQRLQTLGLRDRITAGTFHATALLQLRQRWAERNVAPPTLLDRKLRFVAQLLPRSSGGGSGRPGAPGGGGGSGYGRGSRRPDAADVCAEIDWARARLVGPEHYGAAAAEAGRTSPLPPDQMAEVMEAYQQAKRRRRLVDFDDLLLLALRDLQTDQAYADAVRWKFRHLYVDEFQDVNPLQYELLAAWRGNRPDLFLVGDPNQAIYGWNGADPNLLTRFTRRERSAEVIELVDNYRSTPQVLALAASLTSSTPLQPNRPDGPIPTLTAYPDDRAEAVGVAERVREAHSVAGSWSSQAVLVRTNAQVLLLEQALHDAGVPVRLRAGAGPLATPEVQAELKVLGGLGLGADLAAWAEALTDRLAGGTDHLTPAEIDRRANLAALAATVSDYLVTDPAPSGSGFAAWVATLASGDVGAEADGVELGTFHGAKGLEWSVVHVAGLEEGFVPIAYATTGAQINEERRLLYVAVTRAVDELHLSWAAQRTFGSKPVNRQPSPHLDTLTTAIRRLGVGPAHRVNWRAELARSREELAAATARSPAQRPGPAPGADSEEAAYQALHRWRQRRARAADVPAHAVFTDRTLRAIAASRPRSLARLAAVPGMGPAKLQRYGDDLLQLLAELSPPS